MFLHDLAVRSKYVEDLKTLLKERLPSMMPKRAEGYREVIDTINDDFIRQRRILDEYSKREFDCERKWTKLLKENADL